MDISITHPHIDTLIQAREQLLRSIEILNQNALHIQSQCASDDPDLVEPLEAIINGLKDMNTLADQKLPADLSQAKGTQVTLSEGGWHKFERKFIHDLRNPLGVALGYSEIVAETLEDFSHEPEFQNADWLIPLLDMVDTFADQLHQFNQSLNTLLPQVSKPDIGKVTTLIPALSDPPLPKSTESTLSANETYSSGISSQPL